MALPTVYTITRLLGVLNDPETVISRNKLYEELESGRLQGFKIGNQWRTTEPDVLAWMNRRNESSNDETPGMDSEGIVINLGEHTSVEVSL